MEIDGPKTMFSLEGTIPKHNDLKTYDLVQSGHVGLCTCPLRKKKNDVKAHDWKLHAHSVMLTLVVDTGR